MTRRSHPNPAPPAIAPFTAAEAKAHQEAWAKHLGTQVETTNKIGMSFDGDSSYCEASNFYWRLPSDRVHSIGLRVARAP